MSSGEGPDAHGMPGSASWRQMPAVGEQGGGSTRVEEDGLLRGGNRLLAAEIDEPGHRLAGVDRLEEDSLGAGERTNSLVAVGGGSGVGATRIVVQNADVVGL